MIRTVLDERDFSLAPSMAGLSPSPVVDSVIDGDQYERKT
jgi:hypothetical protein